MPPANETQGRWIKLEPIMWSADGSLQVGQVLLIPDDPNTALLQSNGPFDGARDISKRMEDNHCLQYRSINLKMQSVAVDSETHPFDLQTLDSTTARETLLSLLSIDPAQNDIAQHKLLTTVETIHATTDFVRTKLDEPEVRAFLPRGNRPFPLFLVTQVKKIRHYWEQGGATGVEAARKPTKGCQSSTEQKEIVEAYCVDQIKRGADRSQPWLVPYRPAGSYWEDTREKRDSTPRDQESSTRQTPSYRTTGNLELTLTPQPRDGGEAALSAPDLRIPSVQAEKPPTGKILLHPAPEEFNTRTPDPVWLKVSTTRPKGPSRSAPPTATADDNDIFLALAEESDDDALAPEERSISALSDPIHDGRQDYSEYDYNESETKVLRGESPGMSIETDPKALTPRSPVKADPLVLNREKLSLRELELAEEPLRNAPKLWGIDRKWLAEAAEQATEAMERANEMMMERKRKNNTGIDHIPAHEPQPDRQTPSRTQSDPALSGSVSNVSDSTEIGDPDEPAPGALANKQDGWKEVVFDSTKERVFKDLLEA